MRHLALAAALLAAVIYPLLVPNYLATVGMLKPTGLFGSRA